MYSDRINRTPYFTSFNFLYLLRLKQSQCVINPTKQTFDDFAAARINRVCTNKTEKICCTIFVLCNWHNFTEIFGDVFVNINSITLFNQHNQFCSCGVLLFRQTACDDSILIFYDWNCTQRVITLLKQVKYSVIGKK